MIGIRIFEQIIRAGATQKKETGPCAENASTVRRLLSTSAAGPVQGTWDARMMDVWSLRLRYSAPVRSLVIRVGYKG